MDSHPLVKLAHVLHRVCFAVIKGEGRLLESSRKRSPFYAAREEGFGELVQCLAHGIDSQAPGRWAFTFTTPKMLLFVGEGLAWRSPQSLLIVVITFVIEGYVMPGMGWPSLCMVQLHLQVFYLLPHGPLIILSLGCMAFNLFWLCDPVVVLSLEHMVAHTRMAFAGSSMLRVGEITLLLGFG